MKTHRHFVLPNVAPAAAAVPKVNRYCSAGMCVDTDVEHDANCPRAQPKIEERKVQMSPAFEAPYGKEAAKAEPKDHEVVVHNNDRTPFENVVATLEQAFKLSYRAATDIMYEAHNGGRSGRGIVKRNLTKTEAEALAAAAKKHASTLKNKRGSTLQFSARKM